MMNRNNRKIKKEYSSKNNSDIIHIPQSFRREFLSPKNNKEIFKCPVTGLRLLFKLMNDLSYDQFHEMNPKQTKQLNLFEDTFKTEHNSFGSFKIKITDISDNRNYENVKRGLEFLEDYKKKWYKSTNDKGETIHSYGGLISQTNYSDGYVAFLVSAYWIEKLIKLGNYNKSYLEVAWKLKSTKAIIFYLWVLELKDKGTSFKVKSFQETFDYNYSTNKDLAKNVLKVFKHKFDMYGNKSFNYNFNGDKINIVPYHIKDNKAEIKSITSFKQKVTQKLSYWKLRHELSNKQRDNIKKHIEVDNMSFKLFERAYSIFKKDCRTGRNKIKTTDVKGSQFMDVFQENIKLAYKSSYLNNVFKNGYPRINQ